MAVGVDVIKTVGRLIFELERDEEKTTRSLDIPYPITDTEGDTLQNLVNAAYTTYTDSTNSMNKFIQPANWRDANISEEQWVTTNVHYEIVTTMTRPITPEISPDTLGAANHDNEEHYEQNMQ